MSEPVQPTRLQCSLLILLATPAEETGLIEAARELELPVERSKRSPIGEHLRLGQVGDEAVIASCPSREKGRVVMGASGRFGTAAKAILLRDLTGAQAIVQLGMAFGARPADQRLGDVLVSTALIHYDDRTIKDDADSPSGYVVDHTQAEPRSARPELLRLLGVESRRGHPFGVHMGIMLSGAARIRSAAFRDELVRCIRTNEVPIVGGEMEGVGLVGASSSVDDPIWCVVKAISDFADGDQVAVAEENRSVACRNAATFLLTALQNGRAN